jgi:NADPH:quinone reductase-like Zn-dependent oxidoreductase
MGRTVRASLLSPMVRQRLRGLVSVTRRPDLLEVAALADQGVLQPVIDRAYPLAEAAAALRHVREGHPRGKVVLTV